MRMRRKELGPDAWIPATGEAYVHSHMDDVMSVESVTDDEDTGKVSEQISADINVLMESPRGSKMAAAALSRLAEGMHTYNPGDSMKEGHTSVAHMMRRKE